ncbi:MAG TPA: TIGR03435 family protein [Vicinamibacterales bacterium]|nr:TIGR03435 family protein [Vicinamibacterales bacterium]
MPVGAPLAFEVAAVKQNKSGENFIRFGMLPGGRFTADNAPFRELLRFAFQVQPFQIEGLPAWANSDRFDVTAKAEGEIAPTQPGQAGPIQFMMRTLLAERFGLVYHEETREMPISVLVLARPDGKLGPGLEKSTTDCQAMFAARRGGGPPPPPPAFGEKLQCGFRVGPGTISGGASQMTQLAQFLSQNMGRIVLDKTGLAGNYDFNITYTPDQMPNFNGQPGLAPGFPAIDPNGPPLATAIQEQLGLKLESQRGPVTMFVVDNVSQPTPD